MSQAFVPHCSSLMSLGYMTIVCCKFPLWGQALKTPLGEALGIHAKCLNEQRRV